MFHHDLPLEIFELILGYLRDLADLRSLCLVSTSFNRVLTPKLYETVTVRTSGRSLEYADGRGWFGGNLSKYTKRLRVQAPLAERLTDSCLHEEDTDSESVDSAEPDGKSNSMQRLGRDVAQICMQLPKNQLLEFEWTVGTCVPDGILGERGVIVKNQNGLQRLSLLTNGACRRPRDALSLSRFKEIRTLRWNGVQSAADLRSLAVCMETNAAHLNSLDLGLCNNMYYRTFHHGRGYGDHDTLGNRMIDDVKRLQETAMTIVFPALRCLSLSYVSFDSVGINMINAFNFANLHTLKLLDCHGLNELFREIVDSHVIMHVYKLELVFNDDDGMRDDVLSTFKPFLESLDGLGELHLMMHTPRGVPDLYRLSPSIAVHKNTLTRLIFHLRMLDLDFGSQRFELYEDCYVNWSEGYMEILDCSLLECFGGTFVPASLESLLARRKEKPMWKILHIRATQELGLSGHRWSHHSSGSWSPRSFESELGTDPKLFAESVREKTESGWLPVASMALFEFAQWAFGPRGLPNLQVLVHGDLSDRAGVDGTQPCFLCKNDQILVAAEGETLPIQLSFRPVRNDDTYLKAFIHDNADFFSACEVHRALPGVPLEFT